MLFFFFFFVAVSFPLSYGVNHFIGIKEILTCIHVHQLSDHNYLITIIVVQLAEGQEYLELNELLIKISIQLYLIRNFYLLAATSQQVYKRNKVHNTGSGDEYQTTVTQERNVCRCTYINFHAFHI